VITYHALKDYALGTLAVCATLHSILPPWDWDPPMKAFEDFPKVQHFFRRLIAVLFHNRYYKLAIYIVGFAGAHARSTLWKNSISMPVQIERMQANGKV